MSKTNGNDSIHALTGEFNHNGTPIFESLGLTKREYFTAIAMQGILSRTDCGERYAATKATSFADELINELNKEK